MVHTKLTGAKGDAEKVAKAKDSAETKLSRISSELDGANSFHLPMSPFERDKHTIYMGL